MEAAANVVLPDNGLPWRKLREDDLSDVAVGHLSDELVYVIVNLLRSEPSKRTSIDELQAHPVVNKMQQLRQNGFKLEASSCNGGMDVPVATKSEQLDHPVSHARGAIVEEASDFLPRVMAEVRRIWHSPRKAKIERACHVTTLEQAGQMDIDC